MLRSARVPLVRCSVFRIARVQTSDLGFPKAAAFRLVHDQTDANPAALLIPVALDPVAELLRVTPREIGVASRFQIRARPQLSVRPLREIAVHVRPASLRVIAESLARTPS